MPADTRTKKLIILAVGIIIVIVAGFLAWRLYEAKRPMTADEKLQQMRQLLIDAGAGTPLTQAQMQAKLDAASSTRTQPLTQAEMQAKLDALRQQPNQ